MRATDSGSPSRDNTTTITVIVADLNDETPNFDLTSYTVEIPESTEVGTELLTISATDNDLLSAFNTITYTMTSDDGQNGVFGLNSTTGVITLAVELDFEVTESYSLTAAATDPAGNRETVSIRILVRDINDNTPQWVDPAVSFYISDQILVGHSIGLVKAFDPDLGENGTVRYRLLSVRDHTRFAVHPNTGLITVTREFNSETDPTSFLIEVEAYDDGPTPRVSPVSGTLF